VIQIPSIAIFVRHSAQCRYRDDEGYKFCNCKKHLRWFEDGRQFKKAAKTRSWKDAEDARRELEQGFPNRRQSATYRALLAWTC
jgi:hypothetical protein